MTLPRILTRDAPPKPVVKTEPPTIEQLAKQFGWAYARKVEALRHRVAPPPHSGHVQAVGKDKED